MKKLNSEVENIIQYLVMWSVTHLQMQICPEIPKLNATQVGPSLGLDCKPFKRTT